MMEEKIKKIIEAAILAPSGENCQPWQIKSDGNKIDLFNDPKKDISLYNHNQKGSMVALGAFIENFMIASKVQGLNTQVNMFPDPSNEDWIATIIFSQTSPVNDPIYEAIFRRTTNRKVYKKINLSEEQKSSIINSASEIGAGQVRLLVDIEKIKKLSHPISLNEQLIFENEFLHNFFYEHIRWTKEEDDKLKDGFYIKTLELKPPQKFALKLLRSWKWAQRAKKIGITKQIAKDNAKNYASASALGIVVIPGNSRGDYIAAGRVMERIWLKVTSMGLSLQPMTGVLFFMQKISADESKEFSSEEVQVIKKAYQEISNEFGVQDQTIAMLFRIGDGGEPSARSSRFQISEVMKK
ncbi:MAG TPA: hypothetical protein VF974_06605 [Patescibacteria group bacterium]